MEKRNGNNRKWIGLVLLAACCMFSMSGCGVRETIESLEAAGAGAEGEGTEGQVEWNVKESEVETAGQTESSPAAEDGYLRRGSFDRMENGMRIGFLGCGVFTPDTATFGQPQEGNQLIYFRLYAENEGIYKNGISTYDFSCYADGYKMELFYGECQRLEAELTPGRGTDGYVVFEVPKDAEKIELVYAWENMNPGSVKFLYEKGKNSDVVPKPGRAETADAYQPGEALSNDRLEVTFISESPAEGWFESRENEETVAIQFEVKNMQEDTVKLGDVYDLFCYADGRYCERTKVLWTSELYDEIEPGEKIKESERFEIPKEAETVEVDLVDGNGEVYTFRVR